MQVLIVAMRREYFFISQAITDKLRESGLIAISTLGGEGFQPDICATADIVAVIDRGANYRIYRNIRRSSDAQIFLYSPVEQIEAEDKAGLYWLGLDCVLDNATTIRELAARIKARSRESINIDIDEKLDLTSQEQLLFKAFAYNFDNFCGSSYIQSVLTGSFNGHSLSMGSVIHRLRKKLSNSAIGYYIEFKSGYGYRLVRMSYN